jgi:hypothetical protein
MDEQWKAEYEQLNAEVRSAVNEVDAALEAGEEKRQIDTYDLVSALAQRYRDIEKRAPDDMRGELERGLGRRVVDLRRIAERLSKRVAGQAAERATDAGVVPFLEQRAPSKSIEFERYALRPQGKSVGTEVEAWCGKCKEMREHRIVAVVSGEPKQVICLMCNSRHGYRTEPPARARGASTTAAGVSTEARKRAAEEREVQKRKEARQQLQEELASVDEPRPFDPKGRYKSGEVIVHPEFGRGKIENVLRSSLLVRFLDGLRPLNLS